MRRQKGTSGPRLMVALGFALTLLVAACGQDEADPTTSPSTTPSDDADPGTDEDQATQETLAWFARFNERGDFWVEPVATKVPPTEGVARAAMEYLFSADPVDPALFNFADQGEVLDVTRDGDVLTVDVSDAIRPNGGGHSSTEESAFAQQLAFTATQFEGVRAVRLLVEGEPTDELWGHLDWSQPIEPREFGETPITIENLIWDQTVPQGQLSIGGQANTFEATLMVRLINPSGEVVDDHFTTATSGTGTRGTWTYTFRADLDQPGRWAVEAEEPDPSDGEGRPPLVVRVEFNVT